MKKTVKPIILYILFTALVVNAESLVFKIKDLNLQLSKHIKACPVKYSCDNRGDYAFFRNSTTQPIYWSASLPQKIDTSQMPYVTLLYKATGKPLLTNKGFHRGNHTVFLSGHKKQKDKKIFTYAYPLLPYELITDGKWHSQTYKFENKFDVESFQVFMQGDGSNFKIYFDDCQFSSKYPGKIISEYLAETNKPVETGKFTKLSMQRGQHGETFWKWLRISDWFKRKEMAFSGIPFILPSSPREIVDSGFSDNKALSFSLPPDSKEIFFILASSFPETVSTFALGNRCVTAFSEPERVVIEIVYSDGSSDFIFPYDIQNKAYRVKQGLTLCQINPDVIKKTAKLILHDKMKSASFGIMAITVNTGSLVMAPPPVYNFHSDKNFIADTKVLNEQPEFIKTKSGFIAADKKIKVYFELKDGLKITQIEAGFNKGNRISFTSALMFICKLNDRPIAASEWKLENSIYAKKHVVLEFIYRKDKRKIRAVASFSFGKTGELLYNFYLQNLGGEVINPRIILPCIKGLNIGGHDDTWYLMGKQLALISNKEVPVFREIFGARHPLQIDGVYNPVYGYGLAFMTHDRKGDSRHFCINKDKNGFNYELEFQDHSVEPGEYRYYCEFSISATPGGSKGILNAYRKWLNTWCHPAVSTPDWWRRNFSFGANLPYPITQDFKTDNFTFIDDNKKLKYDITNNVVNNYKLQGKDVHALMWFFMCRRLNIKTGVMSNGWGTPLRLPGGAIYCKQNFFEAEENGFDVMAYFDDQLCEWNQPLFEKVKDWQLIKSDKKPFTSVRSSRICRATPWKEIALNQIENIVRESGAKGVYIDELNYVHDVMSCHDKKHGHPTPWNQLPEEIDFIRKLRARLPSETCVYGEDFPTDIASQYINGSYVKIYNTGHTFEDFSPYVLNLHRFMLPHTKSLLLMVSFLPCPDFSDGNSWPIKFIFFNGDAARLCAQWIKGKETDAFINKIFRIQRKYYRTFTSENVEPLVKTERNGIFANLFQTEHKKIWTVYNANFRTINGGLLKVKHVPGAEYYDIWNNLRLRTETTGNIATINFSVGPREVIAVMQKIP
jgi:hypothetical protein